MGHISSDKPIYKPNDVAFFEVFVIDALTKIPVGLPHTNNTDTIYASMNILDSFDTSIYSSSRRVKSENGTIVFTYKVPEDTKGGDYKIKVESSSFPTTYREFRIKQFSSPELFVTVDFDKNNYSPNDLVTAKVKVRRPDGEKLAVGTTIQVTTMLNDTKVTIEDKITLNPQGETTFNFSLPGDIKDNSVTISVKTFIGYSQDEPSGSNPPHVSSHVISIV